MYIQAQFPGTAPLATGHPHGLPEPRKPLKPQTRVAPIGLARDAEAAQSRGQPPAGFWRAVGGEPDPDHVAPPSILQIEITRLLDAQRAPETTPETAPETAPEPAASAEAAGYSRARNSVFSTFP